MTFILHCKTPASEHHWVLRTGETARVGQSSWVEFSITDDPSLSEEHFSITYTKQLIVEAIAGSLVEVDGNATTSTAIESNSIILAGQCVFEFFQPHSGERQPLVKPVPVVPSPTEAFVWENKFSVIDEVGLSSQAIETLRDCMTTRSAVEVLQSQNLLEDAVRLLAGVLPAPQKFSWCFSALKQFGLNSTTDFCPLINAWLLEPHDASRAQIAQSVPWKETSSPWTWLLASIAWTGGSLGPQDATSIPPPPSMVTSAIIAAMQLSCCQTNAEAFRAYCVQDGLQKLTHATRE